MTKDPLDGHDPVMVPTSLEWSRPDFAYLRKHISDGNVVLFLGAGFSDDAVNTLGASPPLGQALAKILAADACLPYNDEPLPFVYTAALKTTGDGPLREQLRRLYEIKSYAPWYKLVRSTTWQRIYTTNIDDLVQCMYDEKPKGVQDLDTVVCPEGYRARREDFRKVQCIHLHGSVRDPSKPLTFSLEEFARQTVRANPWYQSLVDDLYDRPVLFIGTKLADAPLYHYLELRKASGKEGQRPPKSFLVCRSLSEIQRRNLDELNIVAIDSSAANFFEGLDRALLQSERSVDAVLARVAPSITKLEEALGRSTSLSQHFVAVIPGKLPRQRVAYNSMFFLGAEPTWDDIDKVRDGERDISRALIAQMREPSKEFSSVVLHGPAGSGKSTTLMRGALEIAQEGHTVLYARNEGLIDISDVPALCEDLSKTSRRLFLFVDAFGQQLRALLDPSINITRCANLCVVMADRTNAYTARQRAVSELSPREMAMPDLSAADVDSILNKLVEFGFLGELRGRTRQQQVELFMQHAARQLLVALREATSGRRFDLILQDELKALDNDAKLAYVMCALAVAQGAPGVYKRHLMAALGRTQRRKSVIFDQSLRGILLPANSSGTLLRPRHRLIANLIARTLSDPDMRMEATIALLLELSGDITPNEITRRSPAYLAYRGLINADALCELFGGEGAAPLKVYDAVRQAYDGDFLFWVHYGMAYVRVGNLDVAENYIAQSLGIRPNNFQALHQLGIIYLMQAAAAPNPGALVSRADEGVGILRAQILDRGDSESHPYGAFLTYVSRWYLAAKDLIADKAWDDLRSIAKGAGVKYPFDDVVKEARKEVERAYLLRHVKE